MNNNSSARMNEPIISLDLQKNYQNHCYSSPLDGYWEWETVRNYYQCYQLVVAGNFFKSKGFQYIFIDKALFNLIYAVHEWIFFIYISVIYETRNRQVTRDSVLLSWLLDRFDQVIGIILSILFTRGNKVYHLSVLIETIQGMTTME